MATQKVDIEISGMTCSTCSNRVEKALGKAKGVNICSYVLPDGWNR